MSISGTAIILSVSGAGPDPNSGERSLHIDYKYAPPVYLRGLLEGGRVYIPIAGKTETELAQLAQQTALDFCNNETEGTEEFTLSDVFGGRL